MRLMMMLGLGFVVACDGGSAKDADSGKKADPKPADVIAKDASKDATAKKADAAKKADTKEADPAKPKPAEKTDPAAAPPPAKEISDTRALVVKDGELLSLAPSGKTELVAKVPGMTQCGVDDHHRVVWLTSTSDLSAYDPSDKKVHAVATGAALVPSLHPHMVWSVQYTQGAPFPTQAAGNADGLEHCAGLVVQIGDKPSVGGGLLADGDREIYCNEETEDFDAPPVLNAEFAPVKAGYDKAKLVDAAYLATLAARRTKDGVRKRTKLTAPTAPKLEIDPSNCDGGEEDCGVATYVGGSLWWVVTATSRGDFFHETRELYDTKAKQFWNLATDKRYPKAEAGDDNTTPLEVSPDGQWAVYEKKVLSLGDAKQTGTFSGSFCGWK